MQKLYIKNMVCDRCIMVVKQELEKLNLVPSDVQLGEVEFNSPVSIQDQQKIKTSLEQVGFELIDDKKLQWIEKIKSLIIAVIHQGIEKKNKKINYSEYIAREIGRDYSYLSNLFSTIEGRTIEHFIIQQKIERVKELLIYNELSLNQIASAMGYSSAAHLSNQFKKVTGVTPSYFKTMDVSERRSLDKVY